MKSRAVLIVAMVTLVLSTLGSDCVNSPFTVSINLDPMKSCVNINTGNGTWNNSAPAIVIDDLIDEEFLNGVTGFRLYDIRLRVSDSYPDGTVQGNVSYSFDNGATSQEIVTFMGETSQFKGPGVSLLDPQGIIDFDPVALNDFLSILNDPNGYPPTIVVSSSGSGPGITEAVQVCADLYVQADAEVE